MTPQPHETKMTPTNLQQGISMLEELENQPLPQTDAEFDAILIALQDSSILRAAHDAASAMATEVRLVDRNGDNSWFQLISEAAFAGFQPHDMATRFAGEAARSRARTERMLARMGEVDARLKQRGEVLKAADAKLGAMLQAIERVMADSRRAVKDSDEKVERLKAAAEAAGVDPAVLLRATTKVDESAENLLRHRVGAAVVPIKTVLADPLRCTDGLPAWVRDLVAEMPAVPSFDQFARLRLIEELAKKMKTCAV